MAPRLLLLGAGGFLGRSVAHHIAASGDAELILHSRTAEDPVGFDDGVESRSLDLLASEPGAIAEMIDEVAPDAVINCTGSTGGNLDHLTTANVLVVLRLIAELEKCKSVHLVHLGSAAEYGIQQHNTPVSEAMSATPQGAYGQTKLRATDHLMQAATCGADLGHGSQGLQPCGSVFAGDDAAGERHPKDESSPCDRVHRPSTSAPSTHGATTSTHEISPEQCLRQP